MTRNFTRKAAACATAVAVSFMGLGTSMALAQPADAQAEATVSSITQDQGNLHVTKLTPSTEAQAEGNGTRQANPTGSKPIQGVKFTVQKVDGVDLKTNDGWALAAKIIKGTPDNADNPTLINYDSQTARLTGEKKTVTTKGDGVADFENLPVGLYLVWETIDENVNIIGGEQGVAPDRITKAKPFFVSIPMTNPNDRTEWMYDIYAYPKNNLSTVPTKEVNDDKEGVGSGNNGTDAKSDLVYTLSANVPAVSGLKHFDLVDKFKTSQLTWIEDGANDVVKVGQTELTKGTLGDGDGQSADYYFDKREQGDYTFIAVVLTAQGRAKILKQQGDKVVWTMNARVNNTEGGVEVPNEVFLTEVPENGQGNGWSPEEPGNPGPKVKTYYGKATINKKNESGQPLAGAKFYLYECSPTGFADGDKNVAADWALEEKNRVTVDGKNEWISAADTGVITIDGLLVNDFRNNSTFVNGTDGDLWKDKSWYCLKEVQAPEGYELLPNPIKFQLSSNDGTAVPVEFAANVANNKSPKLPVTGGTGLAILVTSGVLLLAGSGVYVFAANRRREQD